MEIKKYTGFTLIELLAVIVILAVIALIATPIIMNVINDSKEGAAKDAMYGYVKAVELAGAKQVSPTTAAPDGDYTTENGNLKQGSKLLEITIKGTKPENDGTIKISKGNVIEADMIFDGIPVHYDGKKAEVGGSSTPTTPPSKTYSVGEVVYFDPTGTVTDCAGGKEWTLSNTGTTCYKWNVIKDNGTSIEALLDHNTIQSVVWNSSGDSDTGPKEAYNQLKNDTRTWTKAETLSSSDNVTRNNGSGGTYTIDYNGMKGRFISGQEVADISQLTAWTPSTFDYSKLIPEWFYQNTAWTNGDMTNVNAYWTDTTRTSNTTSVWQVDSGSRNLTTSHVYNTVPGSNMVIGAGLRPVVRVLKSNI